jgi:hypothetical protein
MKHSFATLFENCGPGGRKCPCCNPFHGKSKSMLTRKVRNNLKKFFEKEIKSELSN